MKIISKAIRDSARGQPCTVREPGCCNFDPATTVFAHLPVNQRGTALKSPDLFGVHACSNCHDAIDERNGRKRPPAEELLRALAETQLRLVETGLLAVKGIALPDTSPASARAASRTGAPLILKPKARRKDSPTARPSKSMNYRNI